MAPRQEGPSPMRISWQELVISAITGAIFGLIGYFLTRHIHNAVCKVTKQ